MYHKIGQCCINALLLEVHATPKPGLVDRANNGSHSDMNFALFQQSCKAISPYFSQFAEKGSMLPHLGDSSLLLLRDLGKEAEKAMFETTHGVNTHKGAIFSLGFLAASAGYCCGKRLPLTADYICETIKTLAAPLMEDFQKSSLTNGETIFSSHGLMGARGEALGGYHSVRHLVLPLFRRYAPREVPSNQLIIIALLHLLAEVPDTNLIARGGMDALLDVQSRTKDILRLHVSGDRIDFTVVAKLDDHLIRHNLSPGGCADLLAVGLALHAIEALDR